MRATSLGGRFRAALLSASLLSSLTVCDRANPTAPDPGPLTLRIVSGDEQRATIGTELANPVVVQALNAKGKALRGQLVNFVVVEGGGSVYAGSSLTNHEGIAQEYWTLGTEVGPNRLEVRAVDPTTGEKQNFATLTAFGTPVPVARIELSPSEATIEFLATVQLNVTFFDAAGNELTGREVTWASSNEGIATVTDGLVTGVGSGGPVTITATCEGKSAAAQITVLPAPLARIVVEPWMPSISVGGTVQFTALLYDAADNILTDRDVTWFSQSDVIASVSASGLVTGHRDGVIGIVAVSEGIAGNSYVRVMAPIASISIVPTSLQVNEGTITWLYADLRDANNDPIGTREVTWESSNSAVASVTSDGQHGGVNALLPGGPVTITATIEGFTATVSVTVIGVPRDEYEPNNTGLTAYDLGNTYDDGPETVVNANMHVENNDDWFRITAIERSAEACVPGAAQNFSFRVVLSSIPVGNDYDLEVRLGSPSGPRRSSLRSGNAADDINFPVEGTCGTADSFVFYIRVDYYSGPGTQQRYNLSMRLNRL